MSTMAMGKVIGFAALAVFLAWMVYRKTRRLIGKTSFDRRRIRKRLILLVVVFVFVSFTKWFEVRGVLPHFNLLLVYALIGFFGGALFGAIFGLRSSTHVQFLHEGGVLKYRSDSIFGLVVVGLFLLRLGYHFYLMQHLGIDFSAVQSSPLQAHELAEYYADPLNTLLWGLFFAYYITFYGKLLQTKADAETVREEALGG